MVTKVLPYQAGVKRGGIVYISGQISLDKKQNLVGENDIKAQTNQVLLNVFSELSKFNCTPKDIVKVNVYMSDIERDFDDMNEVYTEMMKDVLSVRVTVGCTLFKPEFLIEISVEAYKPD